MVIFRLAPDSCSEPQNFRHIFNLFFSRVCKWIGIDWNVGKFLAGEIHLLFSETMNVSHTPEQQIVCEALSSNHRSEHHLRLLQEIYIRSWSSSRQKWWPIKVSFSQVEIAMKQFKFCSFLCQSMTQHGNTIYKCENKHNFHYTFNDQLFVVFGRSFYCIFPGIESKHSTGSVVISMS